MAVDPLRHAAKWRVLRGLLSDSHVVGLQETHASDEELMDAATAFVATRRCFPSTGDFSQAGGVALFVRRDVGDIANAVKVDIVPGRIVAVEVGSVVDDSLTIFLSVHNFEISARERRATVEYVDERLRPQPAMFAAGDWNFAEVGYETLSTNAHGDTTQGISDRARREWAPFLARFTELAHQRPTRAASTHTTRGPLITESALDRIMTTLPPTTLAMTTVHCRIPQITRAISSDTYQAASDHLPVRTTLRTRQAPPSMQRPIPTWVTRHPLFPAAVTKRLDAIPLSDLTASDALRRTRQAIRSAGAEVRNRALQRAPVQPHQVRQVAMQMVRALHRRDLQGVVRETMRWQPLRDVIRIHADEYTITDEDKLYTLLGRAVTDPSPFFADEAGARRSTGPAGRVQERRQATLDGFHTDNDNGWRG